MAIIEEWERLTTTTLPKFIRGAEDAIMRRRKLLDMLRRNGRITYNHEGRYLDWGIEWKRPPISAFADATVLSFSRKLRTKRAQLEVRGYAATDSVTRFEIEMNKGQEALINFTEGVGNRLKADMTDQFGDKLYKDGNLSNDEIHGFESFCGKSGDVVNSPLAAPSDSYAQIDTTLGAYGGVWDSTAVGAAWPLGTGQAHHDFWSPLLIDYTNTLATASGGWTAATATWAARCLEVIRYGITHANKNKSTRGEIDIVMMGLEFHRLVKEAQGGKERVTIVQGTDHAESSTGFGFADTVRFDGRLLECEYGIPANTAYGFNTNFMELMSWQKNLFEVDGPEKDIRTQSWDTAVLFIGNLKFLSPRNFFKILDHGGNGV